MDKSLLLKPRLPESEVDVPDVGIVRVRGLSRLEAIEATKRQESGGTEALYRYLLQTGMVDPALTADDVEAWMAAATTDQIDPVAVEIGVLSGVMPESAKEAVRTFRADAGDAVRVPPGSEARANGGGAAGADE